MTRRPVFFMQLAWVIMLGLWGSTSLFAEKIKGDLKSVSKEGIIQGRAVDSAHPEQALSIQFYCDRSRETPGLKLFFETRADPVSHEFKMAIPASLGDNRVHTLYAYAVLDNGAQMLSGSPRKFNFKSTPPVQLTITAPKAGQVVSGTSLDVRYTVSGDTTGVNVHWSLDGGNGVHDMDSNGTYTLTGLTAGKHTLTGVLGHGHHETVLNSNVSVSFSVVDAPKPQTSAPKGQKNAY